MKHVFTSKEKVCVEARDIDRKRERDRNKERGRPNQIIDLHPCCILCSREGW